MGVKTPGLRFQAAVRPRARSLAFLRLAAVSSSEPGDRGALRTPDARVDFSLLLGTDWPSVRRNC